MDAKLQCITCAATLPTDEIAYTCRACGGRPGDPDELKRAFRERRLSNEEIDRSGVWRFRELVPFVGAADVVTLGEGNTPLWSAPSSAGWAGMQWLRVKHQGMNPTGS